jgi:hypothetical protein
MYWEAILAAVGTRTVPRGGTNDSMIPPSGIARCIDLANARSPHQPHLISRGVLGLQVPSPSNIVTVKMGIAPCRREPHLPYHPLAPGGSLTPGLQEVGQ